MESEIIFWKVDRPGAPQAAPDVWSLSASAGAVSARRKAATSTRKSVEELSGREQLERFGPNVDPSGLLWPPAFKHNPWTGEMLRPALETLEPNGGRFGSSDGLPMINSEASTINLGSKQSELLERGAFYFAQGGAPGFTYAADLSTGIVHRWSRLENVWVDHGIYPHCSLPPWASGMVGNSDGVYYSGRTAIVRLNEDPEDDGAERYELGEMLSAPASLTDGKRIGVAAPFRTAEGLFVGWLPIGGKIVPLPVKVGSSLPGYGPFAAPAVPHNKLVFWVGITGFISLQFDRHGPEAAWRDWPDGFKAVPHLRPYRAANGQLWALGTYHGSEGGSRAAACLISATSNSPDYRVLDGPHVSAGDHTYSSLSRHRRPWADTDDQIQTGLDMQDRWVLPIVKLPGGETVIALVADSANRRAFLFREATPPRHYLATLFLHRPNAGIQAMGHSFDLATTDDLDVFVREHRLHVYHRDTNECVSWQLV